VRPHDPSSLKPGASTLCAILACACTVPDRSPAVYAAAGMAGRNDPDHPRGNSDNLAGGAGVAVPCSDHIAVRCEALVGDHSVVVTPAVTYDFRLAGPGGPGSIDAHVGVGWTWLSREQSNVLGDGDSPFLRLGAEGHLVGGLLGGVALLLAPLGYDHDDVAVAGLFYVGVEL
jgi:hypothetical protein